MWEISHRMSSMQELTWNTKQAMAKTWIKVTMSTMKHLQMNNSIVNNHYIKHWVDSSTPISARIYWRLFRKKETGMFLPIILNHYKNSKHFAHKVRRNSFKIWLKPLKTIQLPFNITNYKCDSLEFFNCHICLFL